MMADAYQSSDWCVYQHPPHVAQRVALGVDSEALGVFVVFAYLDGAGLSSKAFHYMVQMLLNLIKTYTATDCVKVRIPEDDSVFRQLTVGLRSLKDYGVNGFNPALQRSKCYFHPDTEDSQNILFGRILASNDIQITALVCGYYLNLPQFHQFTNCLLTTLVFLYDCIFDILLMPDDHPSFETISQPKGLNWLEPQTLYDSEQGRFTLMDIYGEDN